MRKVFILFLVLIAHLCFGAEVERHVLPNGMVVIVKERHDVEVVNIQAWVRCGSIDEGPYLGSGISHFVEHMLFKGTEKRGVGQIPEEIAMCGGRIRGYTSKDRTVYSINIPLDYFEKGLEIMADALMNPSFDPQELEKERKVILREIDMGEDDPERVLHRLFWQTAFQHHPCRHPTIGYREIFEELTRDDLLHFHKEMYTPENIILCIVGGVDKERAIEEVERWFKDFRRRPPPTRHIAPEPEQISMRRAVKEFDVKLARLIMGFHIPNIRGEDVYPLDVLASILGEGKSSRLYRRIKEEKGLVYSIGAWSYTPKYEGIFGIDATLEEEKLDEVEEAILDELGILQMEYIKDEELSSAKKRIISREIFGKETVEGEAGALASGEFFTEDPLFSEIYIERISKVTRYDVRRVANRYFRRSNLTIVSLVREREEKALPPLKPKPISITKVELENGLVVLLGEDPVHPIVSIRALFKGGVRVEGEGIWGISNLVRRMLLKGTKARSGEEIAREIEALGGKISTYGGNNSIGISIDLLKEDLEIGLEILADIVMNSSFDEDEIRKEKGLIIAELKSVNEDPFETTLRLMRKTLFEIHPLRSTPSGERQTIEGLSRDVVVSFYRRYCIPNNMVLSIFGDIEKEKVIEMVRGLFKEFKSGPPFTIAPVDEPKIEEIRYAEARMERRQAIIMVGFHGIDVRNEDRYVFEVMTAILTGHDGRLFKRLREERPLSYMVGSFPIIGLDNGAYIFYIATAPRHKEEATEGLLKEIERLREEDVGEEELLRAKRQLIGRREVELQSNSSFGFIVSLDELYGLGYQEYKQYKEKIEAVTKEDIRRVANRYLRPNGYALVSLSPEIEGEE